MDASYHRHDINEKAWALLAPHLSGQGGQWGGIAQDNRRFINAVFWVLRTGAPCVACLPIAGSGGVSIIGSSVDAEKVYRKNFWRF